MSPVKFKDSIDLKQSLDDRARPVWEVDEMQSLDQYLFVLINTHMGNDFFDAIMPILTDLHKQEIFMKYIVPVLLAVWIYRRRWHVVSVLIGAILCVALADNVTYRVLKPTFERPRPPAVEKVIEIRTDRYAGYSFPSNHAANNFAGATFLSYCYPAFTPLFYAVASLIAFSRVYVGVHYPADILAGGLVGFIFGLFFFKIWVIIWLRVERRWPLLALSGKALQVGDTDGNQQGINQTKNR